LDLDLNQWLEQVRVMLMELNDEHDENAHVNDMEVDFQEIFLNINVFHVNLNLYQRHHLGLRDKNHGYLMLQYYDCELH
jgi:hypothetical protein